MAESPIEREVERGGEASTTLVVLVHGMTNWASNLADVRMAIRSAHPDADIYAPDMPYGGRFRTFTRARPARIAANLVHSIDWLCQTQETRGEGYSTILFVGHSMGALILRKAIILAFGEFAEAPFEDDIAAFRSARPWAAKLKRFILISGVTRGWSPNSAASWWASFLARSASFIGEMSPSRNGMLMATRIGFPFMVQTRLQWLALNRDPARRPRFPTIQLLGTIDDVVAPSDSVDLTVDVNPSGRFVVLQMPETNHRDSIRMADPASAAPGPETVRWAVFVGALTRSVAELRRHPCHVEAAMLSDGSAARPDPDVTDVAFVIHGIRDRGFWTQKIALAIKREALAETVAGRPRKLRSMTMSYGYLAMLPFLYSGVRRGKAAWLMDRYTDCRALYPNAEFHYVGHSNGTYLAARALRDYPAARFRRVVFAGSVVRGDYDWKALCEGGERARVGALLNYVANGDMVVAVFPNAFNVVRVMDLGGAGHTGFAQFGAPPSGSAASVAEAAFGPEPSYQLNFVAGGHSAGIKESQWDDIARFVVHGQKPSADDRDFVPRQHWSVKILGFLPPLGLFLLLGLAAAVIVALVSLWPPSILPIALALAVLLLRF